MNMLIKTGETVPISNLVVGSWNILYAWKNAEEHVLNFLRISKHGMQKKLCSVRINITDGFVVNPKYYH